MATEQLLAQQFITGALGNNVVLSDSVGGRIYGDEVPEDAEYPAISIQEIGQGRIKRLPGLVRLWVDLEFLVRAIDQTETWDDVDLAAERIEALIGAYRNDLASTGVIKCWMDRPFGLVESGDQQYRHRGGFYKIRVRK